MAGKQQQSMRAINMPRLPSDRGTHVCVETASSPKCNLKPESPWRHRDIINPNSPIWQHTGTTAAWINSVF